MSENLDNKQAQGKADAGEKANNGDGKAPEVKDNKQAQGKADAGEKANNGDGKAPEVKDNKQAQGKADAGEDGFMFGNKDKEKKFKFRSDWKNAVVVKQSNNLPGTKVEDPDSVKVAPYEPDVFETLIKNDGFKGLNVDVLHKPSK